MADMLCCCPLLGARYWLSCSSTGRAAAEGRGLVSLGVL